MTIQEIVKSSRRAMILIGEFPLSCGVMRDAIKMLLNSRILLPIVYSIDAMPLSNGFLCVNQTQHGLGKLVFAQP
ncbi:hypothetical protein [Burkholderia ubonensis]|uniref:hypothetical protein n=1 Tax=Burkholderia ubonensis TaxID=101571 RepID=UPI001160395E|nr:hypothetical protein [Burkholderia ubonensis]